MITSCLVTSLGGKAASQDKGRCYKSAQLCLYGEFLIVQHAPGSRDKAHYFFGSCNDGTAHCAPLNTFSCGTDPTRSPHDT